MIATLLLAAGKSSRMGGRDKLLEQIEGRPILRVLAERALAHGATYVTLPSADHPRRAVLPKTAEFVVVDGLMSDSLRAGIAALPDTCTGVIILPADMPDITASDLGRFHAAAATGVVIIRGQTSDGRFGHPTYFAASQFARFADLSGDRGAHPLTIGMENDTLSLELGGDRARLDLDTPDDWAAYRNRSCV